jgi:hypothetical protein
MLMTKQLTSYRSYIAHHEVYENTHRICEMCPDFQEVDNIIKEMNHKISTTVCGTCFTKLIHGYTNPKTNKKERTEA